MFAFKNDRKEIQPESELRKRYGRTQSLVPFTGIYKDCVIMRDHSLVSGISLQAESDALKPEDEVNLIYQSLAMIFAKTFHDYQIFIGSRQQRFEEIEGEFRGMQELWANIQAGIVRLQDATERYFRESWAFILSRHPIDDAVHEKRDEYLAKVSQTVSAEDLRAILENTANIKIEKIFPSPPVLARTIEDITRPIFVAGWGMLNEAQQQQLITAVRGRFDEAVAVTSAYQDMITTHAAFYEQRLMTYGPPLRYYAIVVRERPLLPGRSREVLAQPSPKEMAQLHLRLQQKLNVLVEQLSFHFKARVMSAEEFIRIYQDMLLHGPRWRAQGEGGQR